MGKHKRIAAIICLGLIVAGLVVLLRGLDRLAAIQYGIEHKKATTNILTVILVDVIFDLLWAGSTIAAGVIWVAKWKYLQFVLIGSIIIWGVGSVISYLITKNDIALEVTFKRLVMAMPNILGIIYLIWSKANSVLDSA